MNSDSKEEQPRIETETYQLTEQHLIELINGKSFNFMLPGKFHLRLLPPNHGINIPYAVWHQIKLNLFANSHLSYDETLLLIDQIESRAKNEIP